MSVSDPIADMLTIIRNGARARRRRVDVPSSRVKAELARVLLREAFVNNVKVIADRKQGMLQIYLKYDHDDRCVIGGIKRVSTPGRRIYVAKDRIPRVLGGLGTAVLSTSEGILTDKEARAKGLGGELLFKVW
jgi:small subunit ribosomal protein S8